jgi:PBP1b-binding outer membrane lipoprotein LpoB
MKTVLLFSVILGALFQFGCASGPKQDAPMRNRDEEQKTAKQQADFARSLPTPPP